MNRNYTIRHETEHDHRTVETLTREAFWNVYRPGCLEHYVLHQFRDRPEFVKELNLVMEVDGEIIGHIMYVRSELLADDGRRIPMMTFGPISIAPQYKGQGYGTALLKESMVRAKALGAGALAIAGNMGFYGKSGFTPAKDHGIRYADDPDADYFLLIELTDGYLDGITGSYRDPEGYFVGEEEAEAFDREFPPKVKQKLEGQIF